MFLSEAVVYQTSTSKTITVCIVYHIALLKAQVSLQLGKISSSDNEVLVYVMYSYMYWLLHLHTAKAEMSLSNKLISPNMYECFMNTEYLCACLKRCKFEPLARLSVFLNQRKTRTRLS